MPILPVGHIPELNRIAGIETWLGHGRRVEVPLTHDTCAAGALRPERMRHHIVGVQAEQHVRKDRVVIDAVQLFAGDVTQRRAGGMTIGCHAVEGRVQRHIAAQERPLHQVIPAAGRRR
jgi:hypothetical protein